MAQNDTAPKGHTPESVSYFIYEGDMARSERHIKRLWIALICSMIVSLLIVGGFLWYLNQYEYVSNDTVTVDGADGVANYFGKDGNIYYGEDYSNSVPVSTQEERAVKGDASQNP